MLFALENIHLQTHPELQFFCNDWCYVRYLRARQAHAVGNRVYVMAHTHTNAAG